MENNRNKSNRGKKTFCALAECRIKGYCGTCKKRCDGYFEAKGEPSQCLDATKMCTMVNGSTPNLFYITSDEAKGLISENRVAHIAIEIDPEDINKYLIDKREGEGTGKMYQFQLFFGVYDGEKGEEEN